MLSTTYILTNGFKSIRSYSTGVRVGVYTVFGVNLENNLRSSVRWPLETMMYVNGVRNQLMFITVGIQFFRENNSLKGTVPRN